MTKPEEDYREVSLQELSDYGINPFAVQLLVESYVRNPNHTPVRFSYRGVVVALAKGKEVRGERVDESAAPP